MDMESEPDLAHFARKLAITRGYVEGVEVRALCGLRFVPTRDPDGRPPCPDCAFVLELLCTMRSMN
jgi:hypothetical protein